MAEEEGEIVEVVDLDIPSVSTGSADGSYSRATAAAGADTTSRDMEDGELSDHNTPNAVPGSQPRSNPSKCACVAYAVFGTC